MNLQLSATCFGILEPKHVAESCKFIENLIKELSKTICYYIIKLYLLRLSYLV